MIDKQAEPEGPVVGIDFGVRELMFLSTGEHRSGPRAAMCGSAVARRAARRAARRQRGSHRYQKAVATLARHREREANRRRDRAHKLSRELIDRFSLVAVEDLRIRNMVRSARGTVKRPGSGVAQKRALNRRIADQGWGQLISMLAYKAEEAGRRLIKVDSANTSRTCARCGNTDACSRHGARFCCTGCGHAEDADVNAAKVIAQRALAQEGFNRPGRGHQAPTAAQAAVA